jgi:hypothetical protein
MSDNIIVSPAPPPSGFVPVIRRQGRPNKLRPFSREEMDIIGRIELDDLFGFDRRLADRFNKELTRRFKVYYENELKKSFYAQSVLIGVLHERIIKALNNSVRSPLRGLSKYQIDMLCLVYSISELMPGGLFTKQNVRKSGFYKYEIEETFEMIIQKGWIEELDANRIYARTKKVKPKSRKQSPHFAMTRQGKIAMKDYFAAYEKLHKDITGHFLVQDLETIDTKLNKK